MPHHKLQQSLGSGQPPRGHLGTLGPPLHRRCFPTAQIGQHPKIGKIGGPQGPPRPPPGPPRPPPRASPGPPRARALLGHCDLSGHCCISGQCCIFGALWHILGIVTYRGIVTYQSNVTYLGHCDIFWAMLHIGCLPDSRVRSSRWVLAGQLAGRMGGRTGGGN